MEANNLAPMKGALGKADRVVVAVIRTLSYISAVCLVGIMLVAFFNVLGEKLFKHGVPGSTEIVKYLHVPVVFLTAAYVTLDRGQTRIDLLWNRFPPLIQKITETFAYLLGAAISAFVGWRGLVQMGGYIKNHTLSSLTGFGFPVWPFSLTFAVGFFLLAFSFLWAIVRMYAPREPAGESEKGGDAA